MNSQMPRTTMAGKAVHYVPAESIFNFDSGFRHKKLCTGPTFTAGDRCVYRCSYCFVPSIPCRPALRDALDEAAMAGFSEENVVIRRRDAVVLALENLQKAKGRTAAEFHKPNVIYASPVVDVAANMELVRETAAIMRIILEHTCWQIRILSKSHLLPKLADLIPPEFEARIIYGVSTGTLDDSVAGAIERGAPPPSRRIAALRELQDRGLRTFLMLCPVLPHPQPAKVVTALLGELRADQAEEVFAEVINLRGDSLPQTVGALVSGGHTDAANQLAAVHGPKSRPQWSNYAVRTFEALRQAVPPEKLRFLQYVTKEDAEFWAGYVDQGVIPLGKASTIR